MLGLTERLMPTFTADGTGLHWHLPGRDEPIRLRQLGARCEYSLGYPSLEIETALNDALLKGLMGVADVIKRRAGHAYSVDADNDVTERDRSGSGPRLSFCVDQLCLWIRSPRGRD